MVRLAHERVLLIGDTRREVEPALIQAVPSAQVTRAETYFDAIAELTGSEYTAVVAAAEPIERRPDAAVTTLRQLLRGGRLVLFGEPAMETLSRRMLDFGCDDYVITPPTPGELQQIFGTPAMRIAAPRPEPRRNGDTETPATPDEAPHDPLAAQLQSLPLADLILDALAHYPGASVAACVEAISARLRPVMQLRFHRPDQPPPAAAAGDAVQVAATLHTGQAAAGQLILTLPAGADDTAARHFLAQLAHLLGKVITLQNRHTGLVKQAFTDPLTSVWNRRYFEHFLATRLQHARSNRSSVTLLVFDIDDFKKYNDLYGHGQGDEILRQTSALMRRCCREHDLVARLGGDEFAVVFWEREGPRQPKDAAVPPPPVIAARAPQEPLQILRRFQRLIATQSFRGLGRAGRGDLTISGGLASYPWDGRTVEELIAAADNALVNGAKKEGKNRIHLVGGEHTLHGEEPQ